MENLAETTYTPEALEAARRSEERRLVQEGTEIWKARKEELHRQKQREQFELRGMLANYWPWGRPGGGAPCASALRKRNVPLEPSESLLPILREPLPQCWRTRSVVDRARYDWAYNRGGRSVYDGYDHYGTAGPGPLTDEDRRRVDSDSDERVQVYPLTGGVELAALLKKPTPQPQSVRHIATDATRPGYLIDSWRALNAGNREYITDLAEQIRQKQMRATEERRRESENCRRHFDTWRRLWGRPGHGAPIDHARRRNNLHDILYRTPAAAADPAASVY